MSEPGSSTIALTDFTFCPLDEKHDLSSFDCEDDDINNFLKDDAIPHDKERIASTYVFTDKDGKVVAYFCIANDSLVDKGEEKGFTNKIWNYFHRKTEISNNKRRKQYPAIKVGRLGVDKTYKKTGISYQMMDLIKGWALIDHKPACRFLLLDAYNKERQKTFYLNNGFNFMLSEPDESKTRLMYFDMMRFT